MSREYKEENLNNKILVGHTRRVNSVSYSSDGKRIVSGSWDFTLRQWDAVTGDPIGEPLRGHSHYVTSVSYSPDGTRIVSGSADTTVRQWNAVTGEPVGEPLRGHSHYVTSVSYSPDGKRIVSGSNDKTLRQWNAVTGEPVGKPIRGHSHWVTSVSYSPDGTRIVSGSYDTTLRQWGAVTGKPVGKPMRGDPKRVWGRHVYYGPVLTVSYSPDGTRIVSHSNDTLNQWDAMTGEPMGKPLQGHTSRLTSVSYSPDGTWIVSGSDDDTLRIWCINPEKHRTIERTRKIKEDLMIKAWDPVFRGEEFILYMSEVDLE